MSTTVFSGNTAVELQGDKALRFIELYEDHVEYELIGFTDPEVTILDYRPEGIAAIRYVLETERTDEFAEKFNVPSFIRINPSQPKHISIELYQTTERDPDNLLWLAIGVGDEVPAYDYKWYQVNSLGKEKHAFLSLFQRSTQLDLESTR